MMNVGAVPFFFQPVLIIFGILMACVIPLCLLFFLLSLMGRGGRKRGMSQEDMKLVQEVYTELSKMEKRIEALETILLERMRER